MEPSEAQALVELLKAAFPYPRIPDLTVALYREQLARLPDADAARTAVESLIANEERLPPVAVILREYRPAAQRNADERARARGLPEPPPDPENAQRASEMVDRLTRQMEERARTAGRRGRPQAKRSSGVAVARRNDPESLGDRPVGDRREKCRRCERKLEPHEQPEGFCDGCLRGRPSVATLREDTAADEAARPKEEHT
jgi:hypothetical protein